MAVELNIVLSAELSGRKAIRLSWTAEQNANFEVFWKSNVPAGQEFVLLASTNAFTYTTGDLEPSKIYQFYVRGWIGEQFFISNAVELFVSCGKGVVLTGGETDEPPCQLAVIGRRRMADMSNPVTGSVSNFIQDPADDNSFYFLEAFTAADTSIDYRLWKFTWPSTSTLVATITDTAGVYGQGLLSTDVPAIALNPATGAYHYGVKFTFIQSGPTDTTFIDVNLSTGAISKASTNGSITHYPWDGKVLYSYVEGIDLYFCVSGTNLVTFDPSTRMAKKRVGVVSASSALVELGTIGAGIWCPNSTPGSFLHIGGVWKDLNFSAMSSANASDTPGHNDLTNLGAALNVINDGSLRYRFVNDDTTRYFASFDVSSRVYKYTPVQLISEGTNQSSCFDVYKKTSHSVMAYGLGKSAKTIYVSRMINSPSLVLYGTRSLIIDSGVNANVQNCHFAYPYVYVYHYGGDNGQCVTKICNGVG